MSNLFDLAQSANTQEDFVAFLLALARHCKAHPEQIENQSVDAFLEAAASWVEDSDGFYDNLGLPQPDIKNWRPIANVFAAGLIYE